MKWTERANEGLQDVRILPEHRVRCYSNRIAISRNDGNRLTWEEVQRVKCEILGDMICIEVYPAEKDVVNLRHTRHLWFDYAITSAVKSVCRHPEFDLTNPHSAREEDK